MLSLGDFFILGNPFAQEASRFLPLPGTIDFVLVAEEENLLPLWPHYVHHSLSDETGSGENDQPRLAGDRLIVPLPLTATGRLAMIISEVDPAFLRKMSASWLREMRNELIGSLEQFRWAYIDPETDLYNRRAAEVFLEESAGENSGFFLLINTVFPRRTVAGNLQKMQETADLLQAWTQAPCFSFGYGVFGVLLPVCDREQVLKTSHYLQHQLKREGMQRVQIGIAQLVSSGQSPRPSALVRLFNALAIAEKRGPFGICDIDAVEERHGHPFQLSPAGLAPKIQAASRGLARFTLLMVARPSLAGKEPLADRFLQIAPPEGGFSLGEEENLILYLFPEGELDTIHWNIKAFHEHCRNCFGGAQVAMGVASWPFLDYSKGDIPGNCLKALLHGSFLGSGALVFFDHLSLNVSGDLFFEEGDYRAAIREYRRGLRLQPGDVNLINSLGVALVECNQIRQAADCFQEVLCKDPDNYMALVNLGHVQQASGRREQALECFERAYQRLPQEAAAAQELFLPLGKVHAENGNHERAIEIFEHWRSVPGSEKEFLVHRFLGQSYLEAQRPGEAIRACQLALRLYPRDSVSLSLLGLLYVEQGEGTEIGLSLCEKAVALDSFNPDHWQRLGRALLHAERIPEAFTAARHCLRLRRHHGEGLLLLATLHQRQGQGKQARKRCQQVLALKEGGGHQAQRARELLAGIPAV